MKQLIGIFSKGFSLEQLTETSLREGIDSTYVRMSDSDKRDLTREIARHVIETVVETGEIKHVSSAVEPHCQPGIRVLGVNHAGPLDITIEWQTQTDGTLSPVRCHVHSGGDQVNVAKVFSDFGEKIALVALAGGKGSEITDVWEKNFLSDNIFPVFIRAWKDQPVAVINMVDGKPLPVMFDLGPELSAETVSDINREVMKTLRSMCPGKANKVWLVFSAGGPVKYNSDLAYYASLIKTVKGRYRDNVEFLIDFKHVSGRDEALSVLDISRQRPQDIIKPNLEEFIQILEYCGIVKPGTLREETITDDAVKTYGLRLKEKYNLLGVLVSMGKNGLMLILRNRIIREKGVKIKVACHTAAGDSLKAGFLLALVRGKTFKEAAHAGNLFGAATASLPGTQTVTPEKGSNNLFSF